MCQDWTLVKLEKKKTILTLFIFSLSCLEHQSAERHPNRRAEFSDDVMSSSRRAAIAFELPRLSEWCDNVASNNAFLNPSITTYLNDEAGRVADELFVNKKRFADVVFDVDGVVVAGHRAVLRARSPVFARQLYEQIRTTTKFQPSHMFFC